MAYHLFFARETAPRVFTVLPEALVEERGLAEARP